MSNSRLLDEIKTTVQNAYNNYRYNAQFPMINYLLDLAAHVATHPSEGKAVKYLEIAEPIFSIISEVTKVRREDLLARLIKENSNSYAHLGVKVEKPVVQDFMCILEQK